MMFQVVYQCEEPWPEEGPLRVDAQLQGEIRVSPAEARRRAAGYMAGHIAMMVLPGDPLLALEEQPMWRVPVRLLLPGLGEVTTLGAVAVDAVSGEILSLTMEQISAMQRRAHEIAARLTPAATTPG